MLVYFLLLFFHPDKPLIRDLIVEGLSLARTQKEEFSSILNSNDGDINALFETHPYEEVAYEVFSLENKNQTIGMGSLGELENEIDSSDFLEFVKNTMKTDFVP